MALKRGTDITENMAEWIIEELKFKAMIYDVNHAVALYNGDITKSDTNIPSSMIEELKCATKTLEMDEPELQFYEPGSLSKQRDLLAMALYPFTYGKSRILPDKVIGLDEALRHAGQGEIIPTPKKQVSPVKTSPGGYLSERISKSGHIVGTSRLCHQIGS